jgi:hypothetical protein
MIVPFADGREYLYEGYVTGSGEIHHLAASILVTKKMSGKPYDMNLFVNYGDEDICETPFVWSEFRAVEEKGNFFV